MLYNFLMLVSRIIRMMPHSVVLTLGKGAGILYYRFVKKQRERAVSQMMRGLSIPEDEARHLVRESFVNLARNMLEIFYMPNLNESNYHEYVEIDHLERMKGALAEGHGLIVITGHIGTWEWLSASVALAGLPVTAIAKTQPNQEYSRALDNLRKKVRVDIFSRGTSELLSAARALRQGKILGFLMDQDAGPGGAFIDFLGKPASTPMGAAVFSRKTGAPVIPAFILRKPDGRHRVVVGEAMRYEDHGDTNRDLYDFTARMTGILERVIRENPTQWLWFQKRWNTPPEARHEKHHTVTFTEGPNGK